MNYKEMIESGKIETTMPTEYNHLLGQDEFGQLIEMVLQYFEQKGEEVISLKDGFLAVRSEQNEELKYGFDNLVRSVAVAKMEDRESVIYNHFNKINFSEKAYDFFFKDYSFARDHLRVIVKHKEILEHSAGSDLVFRVDFPGTVTLLVFDYENQLRYLKRENLSEWKLTDQELFHTAIENTSREKIEVSTLTHPNGFEFYSYLSGDFAAAWLIELERNASYTIGTFGALVSIPTKGAVFTSALNNNQVMDRISILAPLAVEFYHREPGNITTDFYWYYQGTFVPFPNEIMTDGRVRVLIPDQLEKLLQSNAC